MSAPNIINVTSIIGKTATIAVTTSPSNLITNSSGSSNVLKINCILVSNIHSSNNAGITISVYRNNIEYRICRGLIVPLNASLDVLSKSIYLEEGDSLTVTSSANSVLEVVSSYEIIS